VEEPVTDQLAQSTGPEWIPNGRTARPDYLVRFTDTDGRRHDWHARYDNFDGTGRRRNMAWHTWPDIRDEEDPIWLGWRIGDAKDEFLLLIVHGWSRPFGFVNGDTSRPIYGKGDVRCERKFIVAELTGHGVCPRCSKTPQVRTDGMLGAHNRPRSLDRCSGSHGEPASEGRNDG
jgi:hypothetical protein